MSDKTKAETFINYVLDDERLHAAILSAIKEDYGASGLKVDGWKNTGGAFVAKLVKDDKGGA